MKNSKFFTLNFFDLAKGFVVAVLVAMLSALYQGFLATPPVVDWYLVLNASILAGLGYILKQFTTNSNGALFAKEGGAISPNTGM